ncbi:MULTISPECIES: DUF2750 domain-containing protein [unclassified Vibrio]|uniref:DUF2750 domain-containing protein n=1 Tax=Vibrio sp. HB236076 TaxID=3232307 RepID=A0AB39HI45_9VIBR|nr:DUF2750 domain-containing protein [Vibrio sp. HB161653]MDP5254942.1 DUF2750 domain-containing protein [Vibrio sp. HB161653]
MSTLTTDIEANLALFVKQALENQKVWGLKNDEGWLACESTEFEDTEVMPFWSNQSDAQAHNVDEWSDFDVLEIPLDIFVEDWLITLDEDQVLIGPNWNDQLEGKELSAKEMAELFTQ